MGIITPGEERYISEVGTEWRRLVFDFAESIEDIPAEVTEKIEKLYNSYKDEFSEYYRAEADKGEINYSDEVLRDFEAQWTPKHPEFYDMNKLFEGCGTKAPEKFRKELDRLQKIFN